MPGLALWAAGRWTAATTEARSAALSKISNHVAANTASTAWTDATGSRASAAPLTPS